LRESQQKLVEKNTELTATNQRLEQALSHVKQLRGLLPICSYCHKVRDDKQYWRKIESYLAEHSDLRFSHGLCPECFERVSKELDAQESEES
jgi:hypothetical protein